MQIFRYWVLRFNAAGPAAGYPNRQDFSSARSCDIGNHRALQTCEHQLVMSRRGQRRPRIDDTLQAGRVDRRMFNLATSFGFLVELAPTMLPSSGWRQPLPPASVISTRRFCARPCAVLFEPMGSASPNPRAVTISGFTPCVIIYCMTL